MADMHESSRPLASFLLLTYNQRNYVEAALAGALEQDFSPLEILISDDGSTDGTYEYLEKAVTTYRGPHQICLLPRERNRGWTANVNRTFARAAGRLLLIAAGDDVSLPERTGHMVRQWQALGEGSIALFSSYFVTDARGAVVGRKDYLDGPHPSSVPRRVAGGVAVEGATAAYDRTVFDHFGPIRYRAVNEDVVLQFRASLLGGVSTVAHPLVRYRKWHGGLSSIEISATSASLESANERKRLSRVLRCLLNFRRDARLVCDISPSREAELQPIRALIDQRIRSVILRRSLLSAGLTERLCRFAQLSRIDAPASLRARDLLYALHPGATFQARLFYRRLRAATQGETR